MPADPVSFFPASFAAGRARFRAAASGAGAALAAHANPAPGPDGVALGTEIAWLGPKSASRLLLAMSGTHGVEGFCGSGIETGWLESGQFRHLPADMAVLLIHAINPYGFAWLRRANEDNVDLNRNFVDHGRPYPDNPGYRELRDAISPAEWTAESEALNMGRLRAYAATHGKMALQIAITQGQYFDEQGVYFGGRSPVWSNRTLRAILEPNAGHVRKVAFIDLHTGLGPYAYGEIISNHLAGDPGGARVKQWFGAEATATDDGSSTSPVTYGDTHIGVAQSLPAAEATGITLEYGTLPVEEMLNALRAENWLQFHGDAGSRQGAEIKAQIRAAFYPDQDDWKRMVFERAVDVLGRAMQGLTQS